MAPQITQILTLTNSNPTPNPDPNPAIIYIDLKFNKKSLANAKGYAQQWCTVV